MDGILTSANILLPVWFVQHVNVDSDDVDLDD